MRFVSMSAKWLYKMDGSRNEGVVRLLCVSHPSSPTSLRLQLKNVEASCGISLQNGLISYAEINHFKMQLTKCHKKLKTAMKWNNPFYHAHTTYIHDLKYWSNQLAVIQIDGDDTKGFGITCFWGTKGVRIPFLFVWHISPWAKTNGNVIREVDPVANVLRIQTNYKIRIKLNIANQAENKLS